MPMKSVNYQLHVDLTVDKAEPTLTFESLIT
jgi:hypothetical protein